MSTFKEAATEFLALRRIAVTGVSRTPKAHTGNYIYERLRSRGYEVFAVNPNADTLEGIVCYRDLRSIPNGVDAVVMVTSPEHTESTMRECVELGIGHVWMHRSLGEGSVSEKAAALGREHGIRVIAGGCPLWFGRASDPGHQVMRFVCTMAGKVPAHV